MVQTDLKGLPAFIMNQALKRHPLALHYMRTQLINMPVAHKSPSDDDSEEINELNV